ncbi:Septum formation initiator [Desulfotomaculum nigrificans CO-1-SRB]|uniref:Septum formation initiator n=1 Tax=Desulfotomaculum nigrificans (strain DSM 14880 / VKM B-2319 / CO-1-SRB) TaxID=868595 RepID=F6B4J0_DESCC|nr:septum formation initiator family protein [Desulfotomaculum nigrificans]AEF93013.1 Septum formation initiator [Desulfotomaculum nigrificans CO-1-SRB]
MNSTGKEKVTDLKLHREKKIPAGGRRRRGGGRLILMVSLAIVGYVTFTLGNQISHLHAMQNNVENIQSQIEDLKKKNSALREEIKKIKSDAYVEQEAREKLGLVKPGETLVVPAQSPAGGATPPVTQEQSFKVRDKNIYD